MNIRKISIRNIASIESADIDFENGPLKDSPLFLICGETGSGKTTILDAITLALYGKTPRYPDRQRKKDCQIGGMAFNDARQLVRRGATSPSAGATVASAAVELLGNDGKPYVARWSVDAITRGSNKGRLKDAEWTWKDLSKGGIEYTLGKDIEQTIKSAVGLGFEQFCRTTLLAQGQFTKFLLGDEDAKAEILEKLTNTEKFKKFGIAIGEKYANLKDKAESLSCEVKNMPGLGRERPVVEAKIAEFNARLGELDKMAKSFEARKIWLVRAVESVQSEQKVRSEISAAFAALESSVPEVSGNVREGEVSLGEINGFLAANEPKAEMYAQAGVILTELGHVRDARANKAEAEKNLAEHEDLFPELKKAKEDAATALNVAIENLDLESAKEDFEKQRLEAMNLRQLRKDKDDAARKQGDLKALRVQIKGIGNLLNEMANHEESLEERKAELAEKVEKIPGLEKMSRDAEEKRNAAQKERDKIKSLVDDGIEKIVASLHIGDECPICKSRIEHLNTSEWFSSLLAEKAAAYAAADKACKDAERALNAARSDAEGAKANMADLDKRVEYDRLAVKTAHDDIQESARLFGIRGTLEDVDAVLTACGREIVAIDEKLNNGEAQEKAIDAISRSLKKLRRAKDEAKDALSAKEKACLNCEVAIKQAKDGIETETKRAGDSLAAVSEKIVIPAWQGAWEADQEGWETAFKASADRYLMCRTRLSDAIARLRLVEEQRKELEDGKPHDFSKEDSVESLSFKCNELKVEDGRLRDELAAELQKIAADDRCASDRAAKEKELEAVRAERDEWKPIADLFGDQTGNKVRREIQSYVLMNVLDKANRYLKQLSGRYELSCEGLVLSVVDANEGYAARPVNTLSGGEQFLVSLALALGLAGMNDAGLSVDMLLVDEGFGTLSGGHLNSAIEALERLNALTGSRKVGVISHVERLRERIRTHVEVSRNGHEPSTVKVVSAPQFRG